MILPTLQQLRYLDAVAEHLHFGRAAQACGVTQSALSGGLKELERLLGVTLVERTRRRVMLTPVGEQVLLRARTVLAGARELVGLAQVGGAPLAGDLRLGVIPTIGPYLLPRLLPVLRERYPAARPYLREEQSDVLLASIRRGALDVGILALPYEVGDLEVLELGDDALHVACPVDHPLARASQVTEADLAAAPLLLLEDGHCLRDHALEACRLDPRPRNEVYQSTSLRTLLHMVASGLGVTLVPSMALSTEVQRDAAIAVRPLAGARRRIALVWRRSSPQADDFRRLGEIVREGVEGS